MARSTVGHVGTMPPDGADPAPHTVTAIDDLASELKKLRIASGAPSLAILERRAAAHQLPLPTSTASNALSGRHLPGLDVMRAFVYACGAEDQWPAWKAAWERVAASHRRSRPRPPAGERLFPGAPAPHASRSGAMLNDMARPEATRFLEAVEPSKALGILAATESGRALEMLTWVKPKSAAKILKKLPPEDAARILHKLEPEKAGRILNETSQKAARRLLGEVEPQLAAQVLTTGLNLVPCLAHVRVEQAVRILDLLDVKRVAFVFEYRVPLDVCANLLTLTTTERAARILLELEQSWAGRYKTLGKHYSAYLLEAMEPARVEQILALIDPAKVERIFHHDEYVFGMDPHDLH
ncbi:magnesium transporter MgtE N-terminal domain-containing protein [Streptomyces sp. NPDC050504]|uniref:magnesium transporter MgtE N-terminal domain-containing protein n=1 Tax=Streptomyces sp. NPDC050504 TaxID=3365618 RepID=UPI00378A202A